MRRRLTLAIIVSAALVLSGPYIGLVRSSLKRAFPGRFGLIVNTAIAIAIGSAVLAALVRIKERRALRYGALAASGLVGVGYASFFIHGSVETVTVERFHFVEYGLITFLFYRVWRSRGDLSAFALPALTALLVGTMDEGLQFWVPDRIGELNDLQLNAAAIVCGLLFCIGVDPAAPSLGGRQPGSARRIGLAAAATTFAIAVFIAAVHLGFVIRDPEIGSFKSRYHAGQLRELAAARDASGFRLPADAPRFSREDQYLAEAIWHVQERNARWANDIGASWAENLILERYFSPALKLGYRWPDAQRADAAARASAAHGDYQSAANRLAIYTWNRLAFWSISGLIAAMCLLGGAALE